MNDVAGDLKDVSTEFQDVTGKRTPPEGHAEN
jgi:hypothetical protein